MHINPLTLSVSADGITIAGAAPATGATTSAALLTLAHAHVNAELRSLWKRAPVIQAVELESPVIQFARLSDGHYDLDDLLARFRRPAGSEEAAPQRFALYNLSIRGGRVRFDDRPKSKVHDITEIQLGLPFISNLDDAIDATVEPHLSFRTEDTSFDTGAQATLFTRDRAGVFTVKTGEIDLADWLAYLPAQLPARPVAGWVSADLALHFKWPASGDPDISLRGAINAKSLRVQAPGGEGLAELGAAAIQLTDVQPLKRRLALGAVELDELAVHVVRDESSRLNWIASSVAPDRALRPQPQPAIPAPTTSPPWQVQLGRFRLKDSRVEWRDQAVSPAVNWGFEAIQVDASDVQWPAAKGAAAGRIKGRTHWTNDDVSSKPPKAATTSPEAQWEGQWTSDGGRLTLQLNDVPIDWAGPYLQPLLQPQLRGRAGLAVTAQWEGQIGEKLPRLEAGELTVSDFTATVPDQRAPAVAWKQWRVSDGAVDLAQRTVRIGRWQWDGLQGRVHRTADGQLDVAGWWKAPAATQPPVAEAAPAAPWQVSLADASIDEGSFSWRDDGVSPVDGAAIELQRVKLGVKGLQWPAAPGATSSWQFSARWSRPASRSAPARIEYAGEVGLSPVAWRGKAQLVNLPLPSVLSQARVALPVTLRRGDFSWTGEVAGALAEPGLRLAMKGDAKVSDVQAVPRQMAAASGDDLLRWQMLDVPGVQVTLEPGQRPRIELGAAQVNDFYAQLMVSEEGRFNLADLNAPSPAPAQPVEVAAAVPESPAWPVDLIVGGVRLKNGRVDFADRFVKPSYSASMTDLNGQVGAFRSNSHETASLELLGRVAGTAQLDVRGALNPLARPLVLNVQARATDLELAPLSPYAAKYAGYAIERGKLSMDVAYRVGADGRLDATNRLVLNQLTFGDRVDSPSATKLPVLLAVSLLKDRDGVIDLNLPVGGSFNDPEFSVGGVIAQLIGSLLTKAITAPFSLLSGSDEVDLSVVEFVPGRARLSDAGTAALDKVARALSARDDLRLTITPAADPSGEREAIQAAWLDDLVAAASSATGAGTGADAATEAAPTREQIVSRLYADARLPNKPRNVLGLPKDIPLAEMETLLRASHAVSEDNARELALQRGLAVREALMAKGLPGERLFLAAPRWQSADGAGTDERWGARAQLSLETP
ncbi:DUF748 domain-containing protein [Ideonella sp. DXS29W]|uniref:DUF748 domain-containing protein n=1 Tax=Ideonella lacteola TaxID=2984193 RepID=A0ABU9BI39_9BURK